MSTNTGSRFAKWQEAQQLRREAIIDDYLRHLSKTRIKARHPTALADLVAKHISEVEGEPCNKSTLLRNSRYKTKILTHQARSSSPGTKSVDPRAVTDPTAKVMMTSAQLESGNLRRELERLKIYTTSLEVEVDQLKSQGRQGPSSSNSAGAGTQLSDYELRFVRTCQALRSVLSQFSSVVQVDTTSQRILDMSKRRDNIIVEKDFASPFFEWLAAQGGFQKQTIK